MKRFIVFLLNIFLDLHLNIILRLDCIGRCNWLVDFLNMFIRFFFICKVKVRLSSMIWLLDFLLNFLLDTLLDSILFCNFLKMIVAFSFSIILVKIKNGSWMDLITFWLFIIFVEGFSCNSSILIYWWGNRYFWWLLNKRRLFKTFLLNNYWWTLQSILNWVTYI